MDKDHIEIELQLPYNKPKDIAFSQQGVKIIKRDYKSDHVYLKIKGPTKRIDQIKILLNK